MDGNVTAFHLIFKSLKNVREKSCSTIDVETFWYNFPRCENYTKIEWAMSKNLIKKLFQYFFHEDFSQKHLREEIKCKKKHHKSTEPYWKNRRETHRSTASNIDVTYPRIFPRKFHQIFLRAGKKKPIKRFSLWRSLSVYIFYLEMSDEFLSAFYQTEIRV